MSEVFIEKARKMSSGFELIKKVNDTMKKPAIVAVKSGDTVKVYQKIKEGDKERVQMFRGTVIRTDRMASHTARITVRKMASGVGVEKSFLLHSPLVEKIEVVARGKVRRNNLSYLRNRSGKSARLSGVDFDRQAVNDVTVDKSEETGENKETVAKTAKPSVDATAEAAATLAEEEKTAEVQAEKEDVKEQDEEPAE
jgi:large subunit ribosomal protein L19